MQRSMLSLGTCKILRTVLKFELQDLFNCSLFIKELCLILCFMEGNKEVSHTLLESTLCLLSSKRITRKASGERENYSQSRIRMSTNRKYS